MLRNVMRAMMLLTITLSAMTFSTNTFAKSGLNSKMAKEVRMSLWTDGVEIEFKDAYSYYMEMLEADQSAQAQEVAVQQMPDELLIPLMEL
jgi:hypothetical protein